MCALPRKKPAASSALWGTWATACEQIAYSNTPTITCNSNLQWKITAECVAHNVHALARTAAWRELLLLPPPRPPARIHPSILVAESSGR